MAASYRPPFLMGEMVVWKFQSNNCLTKFNGIVKWIGFLPEFGEGWIIGIDFNQQLPIKGIDGEWGGKRLFSCSPGCGLLLPAASISLLGAEDSGKSYFGWENPMGGHAWPCINREDSNNDRSENKSGNTDSFGEKVDKKRMKKSWKWSLGWRKRKQSDDSLNSSPTHSHSVTPNSSPVLMHKTVGNAKTSNKSNSYNHYQPESKSSLRSLWNWLRRTPEKQDYYESSQSLSFIPMYASPAAIRSAQNLPENDKKDMAVDVATESDYSQLKIVDKIQPEHLLENEKEKQAEVKFPTRCSTPMAVDNTLRCGQSSLGCETDSHSVNQIWQKENDVSKRRTETLSQYEVTQSEIDLPSIYSSIANTSSIKLKPDNITTDQILATNKPLGVRSVCGSNISVNSQSWRNTKRKAPPPPQSLPASSSNILRSVSIDTADKENLPMHGASSTLPSSDRRHCNVRKKAHVPGKRAAPRPPQSASYNDFFRLENGMLSPSKNHAAPAFSEANKFSLTPLPWYKRNMPQYSSPYFNTGTVNIYPRHKISAEDVSIKKEENMYKEKASGNFQKKFEPSSSMTDCQNQCNSGNKIMDEVPSDQPSNMECTIQKTTFIKEIPSETKEICFSNQKDIPESSPSTCTKMVKDSNHALGVNNINENPYTNTSLCHLDKSTVEQDCPSLSDEIPICNKVSASNQLSVRPKYSKVPYTSSYVENNSEFTSNAENSSLKANLDSSQNTSMNRKDRSSPKKNLYLHDTNSMNMNSKISFNKNDVDYGMALPSTRRKLKINSVSQVSDSIGKPSYKYNCEFQSSESNFPGQSSTYQSNSDFLKPTVHLHSNNSQRVSNTDLLMATDEMEDHSTPERLLMTKVSHSTKYSCPLEDSEMKGNVGSEIPHDNVGNVDPELDFASPEAVGNSNSCSSNSQNMEPSWKQPSNCNLSNKIASVGVKVLPSIEDYLDRVKPKCSVESSSKLNKKPVISIHQSFDTDDPNTISAQKSNEFSDHIYQNSFEAYLPGSPVFPNKKLPYKCRQLKKNLSLDCQDYQQDSSLNEWNEYRMEESKVKYIQKKAERLSLELQQLMKLSASLTNLTKAAKEQLKCSQECSKDSYQFEDNDINLNIYQKENSPDYNDTTNCLAPKPNSNSGSDADIISSLVEKKFLKDNWKCHICNCYNHPDITKCLFCKSLPSGNYNTKTDSKSREKLVRHESVKWKTVVDVDGAATKLKDNLSEIISKKNPDELTQDPVAIRSTNPFYSASQLSKEVLTNGEYSFKSDKKEPNTSNSKSLLNYSRGLFPSTSYMKVYPERKKYQEGAFSSFPQCNYTFMMPQSPSWSTSQFNRCKQLDLPNNSFSSIKKDSINSNPFLTSWNNNTPLENPVVIQELLKQQQSKSSLFNKNEWRVTESPHFYKDSSSSVTSLKLSPPAESDVKLKSGVFVDVYVEDATSSLGPIKMKFQPEMTIKDIKLKMQEDYKIPYKSQRWIIGKELALDDTAVLKQYNISSPGVSMFLYITTSGFKSSHMALSSNYTKDEQLLEDVEKKQQKDWTCKDCRNINDIISILCVKCGRYADDKENEKMLRAKRQQQKEIERKRNFEAIIELNDKNDIVLSTFPFTCPVCFAKFEDGGIMLRDCLHVFCKECLQNSVEFCESAAVPCPFRDEVYSCTAYIQDREIRALVSGDIYNKHLNRSVREVEGQLEKTFHCKTPDCLGWCEYDDNTNEFTCPVCEHRNCLSCQAIHEEMNCQTYQNMLSDDTSEDALKTKKMLEELLSQENALKCPQCQVILIKKWGCDWAKCSVCKTEICWVTKGLRWGPGGKGDTSGGCKCGVKGIKCHPKCNYCH